eukprot:CAMPEP_0119182824 /NCGR_PEP_ID=MMETSP1315-20130426/62833_1 /TAXON_ID=676789 /ORGANISM="Prasinoderma singularis, Strain RCC927" /LENGTH=122 /DNA_ID=CAMNT_0007177193 /DNA_START=8 /DNA_END=373 /DNA_ORIENTATION=+
MDMDESEDDYSLLDSDDGGAEAPPYVAPQPASQRAGADDEGDGMDVDEDSPAARATGWAPTAAPLVGAGGGAGPSGAGPSMVTEEEREGMDDKETRHAAYEMLAERKRREASELAAKGGAAG